jgi:hypothetical protein
VAAHPVLIDRDRTLPAGKRPKTAHNLEELEHYFESSKMGPVIEDGLQEIMFGEYLVEQRVLDRYQLLRALQLQDKTPNVRLGECAVVLGYAAIGSIEHQYSEFLKLVTITID